MSWPTVQLQDLASKAKGAIVSGPFGSNIGTRFFVDEGVPIIRGNNLSKGEFKFIDSGFVFLTPEKATEFQNCIARTDDLIFTAAGSIGQVGLIPADSLYEEYVISNKQIRVRLDLSEAVPLFVYYWLSSPRSRTYLEGMNNGGAVPLLNLGIIRRVPVPKPPVDTQRRIASILSAYDDLIENNRRRIQLLEQSARLLYKEWFVHLRFPGHERVKLKDGVPEGWERKKLIEICDSVRYGYTASSTTSPIGPKLLRITDIVPEYIDWPSVPYCEISDEDKEKFRLKGGDIVVARTGATVGYAKRLHKRFPDSVFASYLVCLRLNADVDDILVGIFVESDEYKGYIAAHAGGAAQPNANAQVIAGASLLIPSKTIQSLFRETVEPMLENRELLIEQIEKLTRARDLLLPKLMSGEVVV